MKFKLSASGILSLSVTFFISDCPVLIAWHSVSVEHMLEPMLELAPTTSITTVNTIVAAACTRTLSTATATLSSTTIAIGPFAAVAAT